MADKKKSSNKTGLKKNDLYEMYEERRAYPRITTKSPGEIVLQDGERLNVMIYDISPDGVQLRCNRKAALKIHPSGKFISEGSASLLDMKFVLNVNGTDRDVYVQATLTYLTILSEDELAFGARFLKFSKLSERHLEAFIMDTMNPDEEKVLDILDQPRSAEDINQHLEQTNINLEATLNSLMRNKDIISYGKDKQRKFVKSESALEELFERVRVLEKEVSKLKKQNK